MSAGPAEAIPSGPPAAPAAPAFDPRPVMEDEDSIDLAAIGIRRSWFGMWAHQLRRRFSSAERRPAQTIGLPPDDTLPPVDDGRKH